MTFKEDYLESQYILIHREHARLQKCNIMNSYGKVFDPITS